MLTVAGLRVVQPLLGGRLEYGLRLARPFAPLWSQQQPMSNMLGSVIKQLALRACSSKLT